MRLFIAIQLDDAIKNALTGMQAMLRAARVSGNYTKIENLHLGGRGKELGRIVYQGQKYLSLMIHFDCHFARRLRGNREIWLI